jgi:hypothetical protein
MDHRLLVGKVLANSSELIGNQVVCSAAWRFHTLPETWSCVATSGFTCVTVAGAQRLCLVLHTLISGFHSDVDKICTLLGCYAAPCGNCLPTFRDNVSVSSSKVKRRKDGTERHLCGQRLLASSGVLEDESSLLSKHRVCLISVKGNSPNTRQCYLAGGKLVDYISECHESFYA